MRRALWKRYEGLGAESVKMGHALLLQGIMEDDLQKPFMILVPLCIC